MRSAAAAGVHVFTALGVVCALLAMIAVSEARWELLFFWLGLAMVIDGADGTLARLVDVKRHFARISGERLDQIVDYATYVFVPVLALLHAGFLSGLGGVALGALVLLSSLFHFCDLHNKAEDHSFVGFPAVWNIIAFYAFAFALPEWAVAVLVVICSALTFVPMRWTHPLRVTSLRGLTLALTALWAVAAGSTLWSGFPAQTWAKVALMLVAAYAVALALLRPWYSAAERDHA